MDCGAGAGGGARGGDQPKLRRAAIAYYHQKAHGGHPELAPEHWVWEFCRMMHMPYTVFLEQPADILAQWRDLLDIEAEAAMNAKF